MRALCGLFALTLSLAACGGDAVVADGTGDWVGSASTDGNVTTVRNEAGSKWGGPATLVEAASIGVGTGAPEYMLGSVASLWITDDEIYLIDSQVPAVRVYDWEGNHLRDIGGVGQGPGEYLQPRSVLVGVDGRVYVSEGSTSPRINVYSHDGGSLDTWRMAIGSAIRISGSLTMRHDGALLSSAYIMPDPREIAASAGIPELTSGVQQVGPEGVVGDFSETPDLDVDESRISSADGRSTWSVPYATYQVSSYSPTGAWIVGDNGDYSFEVHYPDGRVVRTRRFWAPVPIEAEHAEYLRRRTVASVRRRSPDFDWDGGEIPEFKPAYYSFYPTQGDQVLVVREGSSHLLEGCDTAFDLDEGPDEDCYPTERIWDMFDLEGNYLGEVTRPDFPHLFTPFWRDDALLLVVEDEVGTVMVKRFRFRLPGESGD